VKNSALVFARVGRALIQALGMQSENMRRQFIGLSMIYSDAAFFGLIYDEKITEADIDDLLGSDGHGAPDGLRRAAAEVLR
jgi:hypothetical protein